jgi:hypothetical protein
MIHESAKAARGLDSSRYFAWARPRQNHDCENPSPPLVATLGNGHHPGSSAELGKFPQQLNADLVPSPFRTPLEQPERIMGGVESQITASTSQVQGPSTAWRSGASALTSILPSAIN